MTIAVDDVWIETFTGKKFHLLNPRQEEIDIRDIAHALSMQVRYTGHVREFISVAEHSIAVANQVPEADRLWGLLHDASEAYIGDVSRPLKHLTSVGAPYIEIEARIMEAICRKFSLVGKIPPSVKVADDILLHAEKRKLMSSLPWDGSEWEESRCSNEDRIDFPEPVIACWHPKFAEQAFLACFIAFRAEADIRLSGGLQPTLIP